MEHYVEKIKILPEDLINYDIVSFMYAPLSSIDVERSFSECKILFSNKHQKFTFANIKKNVLQYTAIFKVKK
jgi:hypothetical protein